MALSFVQYAGNGTTGTFAVPFKLLAQNHLQVRVNLDITQFAWDSPNTIRITPTPPKDSVIEIRRVTPRENPMVDFVDGSVLTESDLDLAVAQTFYIVQEAIDIAGGTLELLPDGSYGAGGRRIKNLGSPVEARDAVTKEHYEGTFLPQLQGLLASATAQAKAATDAMNTVTQARTEVLAALKSANDARDLAVQARETATAAAATATTKAGEANTSRAGAVTAQDASEAAAALSRAWAFGPLNTDVAGANTRSAYHYATYTSNAYAAIQTIQTDVTKSKTDAAASAAAAKTFDPANFYTKGQADGRYFGTAGGTQTGPVNISYANPVSKMTFPNVRSWYWNINSGGTFRLVDETAGREVAYFGPGGNANFWGDIVFSQGTGALSLTAELANRPTYLNRAGVRAIWAGSGSLGMTTLNHLDFHWSNGIYYRVDGNGYVLINQAASDARFKDVKGPVKDATATLAKLNPVTYEFNRDTPIGTPEGVRAGFLAQELRELIPSAVTEVGVPDGEEDTFLALVQDAPVQLIAILVKAVQELTARVRKLEKA